MRKTIILLLATAISVHADIGRSAFNMGPYTSTATNSNYATMIGYASGYMANGLTRSTLLGGASGRHGYSWMRCVGLGYGALDGASNLTDCVAIGDKAGAGWRNRTGWVQIGDAIAVTNGIADIKAPNGARIGPLRLGEDAYSTDNELKGNLIVSSEYNSTSSTRTGGRIYAGDYIEAPQGYFAQAQVGEISFISSAVMIDTDDANRLCVYTNGVLAGYLTITPPAAGNQ